MRDLEVTAETRRGGARRRPLRAFATRVLVLVALSASAASAFAQPPPPSRAEGLEELNLAVGDSKTISAKGVKNFSESVPGVVETKVTPDGVSFIINAKKSGSTSLILIYSDGSQMTLTINVWARPPHVVEREVAQLLDGISGVRRRRMGPRVILDGSVSTEAESKRIQQIAAMFPGQVESLVVVAPGAPQIDLSDQERHLVRIDIYFVQYDRRTGYAVGLGFPDSIGTSGRASVTFDFITGAARSATASLTDQALPRLDMAQKRGWAKILKQATVVTNNGVEASFQNGGEQLYSVTQGLATGIQKIPFGADVSVLPRYRPDRGLLDVRVVADVSELSTAGSGTSLPSRVTSKLTTNVTLRLGQALALSGIRSKYRSHDVAGLPLLSDLPILGILFGSHQDRTTETEGAILVVPSVVTSAPGPANEMVDSALRAFEEYSGDIDSVSNLAGRVRAAPGDRATRSSDSAPRTSADKRTVAP